MKHLKVESEDVDFITYDPFSKILTAHYKKGSSYQFIPVPDHVFAKLEEVKMKGSFFNRNILNVYRSRPTPAPSTKELHETLSLCEGVEEILVENDEKRTIELYGPCRILINRD